MPAWLQVVLVIKGTQIPQFSILHLNDHSLGISKHHLAFTMLKKSSLALA